jgi:hypothetical protein
MSPRPSGLWPTQVESSRSDPVVKNETARYMPVMNDETQRSSRQEDPSQEELIRLIDVPNLPWLPQRPNGKRGSRPTIYRWAYTGVRGVRLRTLCVGGVRCTTRAWLLQFFEELTGTAAPGGAPKPRSPSRRASDLNAVRRELEDAGI